MAEHWIDAATAVGLVIDGPHDLSGMRSLCARARDGLVQTKARLFIVGEGRDEERKENVPIPPKFWWAGGHESLEQNWAAGDFSTWIDHKRHLRAFGVTFALSDVLEMLPSDRRALVARRLSVAGSTDWMPARQASLIACKAPGVVSGPATVLEQARLGLITGRAVLAQGYKDEHIRAIVWEEREWDVPTRVWDACMFMGQDYQDWPLGRFRARIVPLAGAGFVVLSGTYFLSESLQVLMPAAPPAEPAPPVENVSAASPAKAGAGGRPPAEWWDDLWCHVLGLIYDGTLIPKTQADIEEAMHSWANDHGHEPAVSTIRLKARKLHKT